MIYPTRRAVLAAAAGAPVSLTLAALTANRWMLGLAWPLSLALLCLIDALRTRGSWTTHADFPASAYVGELCRPKIAIAIDSRPRTAEVSLALPPIVRMGEQAESAVDVRSGLGAAHLSLTMIRRGLARFDRLWLRWSGPLGLMWRQEGVALDVEFPILPDLRPVHRHAALLFERHAEGFMLQPIRGEGSDFDSLVEFRQGMDRRTIDWKHSARNSQLLAKRYHGERNNQIMFAIDSGRQMSDPIAGLPRVDRVVSAMLLTGWLALKLGDRVAVQAFDSRPRLSSGLVSGSGAFIELQRAAASIDYSSEETNYTFALTTLSAQLTRRSMIILFTEVTDRISANFLLRALKRLIETHVVLVVVLRDVELEQFAERRPASADDITRAITAAALLKERRVVISGLQHLGVHVVEADHDKVSQQLAHAYLDLKRRNLL